MDRKPARVISDHRITIPDEFREAYDLEEGDRVWVDIEPIEGDSPIQALRQRHMEK